MPDLNVYTSTGSKLIHHPDVVKKWQRGFPTPVSLQLGPTSRCNLNCSFCSNAHREVHEDLDFDDLVDFMFGLKYFLGTKTVEITGGGDPTLYPQINELIDFLYGLGLEVGMITNGTLLKTKIEQECLDMLKWVRISMNSLKYVDHIDIPEIKGTLGFSFVWNNETELSKFEKVRDYVREYNPKYVRLVTDCLASDKDQKRISLHLSQIASELGSPYMFQPKTYQTPKECWWGYFKPFLLHNGWVYPCSSVVLNNTADRSFHKKFRMVHMDKFKELYEKEVIPFDNQHCDRCVFFKQNDICSEIRNPNEMVNFI